MPYTDRAPFSLTFMDTRPRPDFFRFSFSARSRSISANSSSDTAQTSVWTGRDHYRSMRQPESEQVLACDHGDDLLPAQAIGHGRRADVPTRIERPQQGTTRGIQRIQPRTIRTNKQATG